MKTAGFTMIELMVALTISLILSTLLFNYYVDAAGTLSMQSSMYHLQEVANISNDAIINEIQQAGYIGCAKLTASFPVKSFQDYSFTLSNKLIVTDTQIISRHASIMNAELINFSDDNKTLYVSDNMPFKPDDILIISDCHHAEIFKVKTIFHLHQQLKIESTASLDSHFDVGAEVAYFEINQLFLKKINKNKKALFLEDINYSRRQIADGVEALNFSHKSQGISFSQTLRVNTLQRKWGGYVAIS